MAYTSDKRLHVNADRSKVVDGDSPEAAFLLVGEGGELSDEEAKKYGLTKSEKKAESAPPENKAEQAPANKPVSGVTFNRAGSDKK